MVFFPLFFLIEAFILHCFHCVFVLFRCSYKLHNVVTSAWGIAAINQPPTCATGVLYCSFLFTFAVFFAQMTNKDEFPDTQRVDLLLLTFAQSGI